MERLRKAIEEAKKTVKKFPGVLTSTSSDGIVTFSFPGNKEIKFIVDGILVDKIRKLAKKSPGKAFALAKKRGSEQ